MRVWLRLRRRRPRGAACRGQAWFPRGAWRSRRRRKAMAQQPPLFAPWRMPYIRGLADAPGECFLCAAGAAADPQERRNRLVLWTTPLSLVMLNLYPYINGHLLVAPRAHKADLEELTQAEQLDLQWQTT